MDAIDSYIQGIPAEILTTFFLSCVPYPTRDNPGPQISRNHPAVVLSHVCHDWRELVLNAPVIWSRMHISTPSEKSFPDSMFAYQWCPKLEVLGETTRAWVERSAQCPLTIFLNIRSATYYLEWDRQSSEIYDRFHAGIFQCSKRWQNVDIHIDTHSLPAQSFLAATNKLTGQDLPILASLKIRFGPGHDYHSAMMQDSRYIDVLSGRVMEKQLFSGPSLRRVTLQGQWDIESPFGKRMKLWTSLQELDINLSPAGETHSRFDPYPDFGPSHALQILQALPSLLKASFTFHRVQRAKPTEETNPVTHPNLQSLSLRGVAMGPEFAQSLVLPSLTVLRLAFDPYQSLRPDYDPDSRSLPSLDEYEDGVVELLRIFGHQLTALTLNPGVVSLSSLPSCLELVDNGRLESLCLIPRKTPTSKTRFDPHEDAEPEVVGYEALGLFARPDTFLNLKRLEMYVRGEESVCWRAASSSQVERGK